MEYSDGYLREFLPENYPPMELVPADVIEEVQARVHEKESRGDELQIRSIYWTYAIFSEMGLGFYESGPRWGFPWARSYGPVAVGLYDNGYEKPGFGISINVPRLDEPGFELVDEIGFPRLKIRFPVAVRHITDELHSAPNPLNATSACWAKCNRTGRWGIITAAHATSGRSGRLIPLDDRSTGILGQVYWQPIDAAFVLTAAPTAAPSLLPVINFPAAGLSVSVETKSGSKPRTIVSACNSLGFFQTRDHQVLFYLDQPCGPGDSGSLVRLNSGEACGIYNGAQRPPPPAKPAGYALNFAQAMFALETTAFR